MGAKEEDNQDSQHRCSDWGIKLEPETRNVKEWERAKGRARAKELKMAKSKEKKLLKDNGGRNRSQSSSQSKSGIRRLSRHWRQLPHRTEKLEQKEPVEIKWGIEQSGREKREAMEKRG